MIVAANWIMGPWKGLAYEMVEAGLMVMGIMVMVMVIMVMVYGDNDVEDDEEAEERNS